MMRCTLILTASPSDLAWCCFGFAFVPRRFRPFFCFALTHLPCSSRLGGAQPARLGAGGCVGGPSEGGNASAASLAPLVSVLGEFSLLGTGGKGPKHPSSSQTADALGPAKPPSTRASYNWKDVSVSLCSRDACVSKNASVPCVSMPLMLFGNVLAPSEMR